MHVGNVKLLKNKSIFILLPFIFLQDLFQMLMFHMLNVNIYKYITTTWIYCKESLNFKILEIVRTKFFNFKKEGKKGIVSTHVKRRRIFYLFSWSLSFNSFSLFLQVYMSNLWVTNYPSGHQALIQMIEPLISKRLQFKH